MAELVMIPSSLSNSVQSQLPTPLTKVELHVHLTGAARLTTLYELIVAKKLKLPGNGGLGDFQRAVQVQQPKDLKHFLSGFDHFTLAFLGDPVALERISYEFCEDEASNGVAYAEARMSPHVMTSPKGCETDEVIRAVLRGFQRGKEDFGVETRIILVCIRGRPESEWRETIEMCQRFKQDGVVGIDVAGDEGALVKEDGTGIRVAQFEKDIFRRAKELGIRRTAHAGEAGPAQSVLQALDELHAERIGHGYHALDDPAIYERCLKENIHFETCPASSILTGAVSLDSTLSGKGHPIVRFALDKANFSINTDDPTITGTGLQDEYNIVRSWGLTDVHIMRANLNALWSSFLPDVDRERVEKSLLREYGIMLE